MLRSTVRALEVVRLAGATKSSNALWWSGKVNALPGRSSSNNFVPHRKSLSISSPFLRTRSLAKSYHSIIYLPRCTSTEKMVIMTVNVYLYDITREVVINFVQIRLHDSKHRKWSPCLCVWLMILMSTPSSALMGGGWFCLPAPGLLLSKSAVQQSILHDALKGYHTPYATPKTEKWYLFCTQMLVNLTTLSDP